jgi:FkbM family methyltransferase
MLIQYNEILEKYRLRPLGVIHVGAHWGEEAEAYYKNGAKKTIWVEANPMCMKILKENVKKFQNPYISMMQSLCINACLSDKDDEIVTFNISNNEGQSSSFLDLEYHKIAHQEVVYQSKFQTNTRTLNSIFEDYSLFPEDFSFLNADIQGAELLMLKGATNILPHMDCLYIEVNEKELYKDCALIGEVDEFLKTFGFIRKETEMTNFGWGDAVYLKKDYLEQIKML